MRTTDLHRNDSSSTGTATTALRPARRSSSIFYARTRSTIPREA